MKISILQMQVQPSKKENLAKVEELIKTIPDPEMVILPEMFNCPYDISLFPDYAEEYGNSQTVTFLAEMALRYKIFLVGGSIPEKSSDKIFNTCFVFNPKGELVTRYRKTHLFDVHLSDGLKIQESKTLTPGDQLVCFDANNWRIGLAICYDIRFPELTRALTQMGAEILLLPAVFNMKTGPAHWQALLRIRAVDNQIYLVGASSAHNPRDNYVAYGHSMIVDPWGKIIAQATGEEEIITGTISKERITQIRRDFPLLRHGRTDLSIAEISP